MSSGALEARVLVFVCARGGGSGDTSDRQAERHLPSAISDLGSECETIKGPFF